MTMQILLDIVYVILGIVALIGVCLFVYMFGRRSMLDNPDNATILYLTGNHAKPVKGKMVASDDVGVKYNYGEKSLLVPSDYGEYYIKGRRLLFVNKLGQLIASPFNNDMSLGIDERDDLIYSLTESQIGKQAVSAIKKGTTTFNVIIIAAVAFFIGIGGTYTVTQFQAAKQQQIQQQQQQQQQQPDDIQIY